MNLNDAAKYAATKENPNPTPTNIWYWKSKIMEGYRRNQIQLDVSEVDDKLAFEVDENELESWLAKRGSRTYRGFRLDMDIQSALDDRFKGRNGPMSDWVNEVLRQAIQAE